MLNQKISRTLLIALMYLFATACSEQSQQDSVTTQQTGSVSQTQNEAETEVEQGIQVVLLAGNLTSLSGEKLAAVPVRARRANSNMAVTVYTNPFGEYFFPEWSDLAPGAYTVSVELAEYDPVNIPVVLSAGQTRQLDFSLYSREPSIMDATARDIVNALPGTDEQKHLLMQCDNCHSLQWALRKSRSRQEWMAVVLRMLGPQAASQETPGTRSSDQKKYIEPLVDYLTEIRGPESPEDIPFKLHPRPTDVASTRLVVTEYDIPRGGNDSEWPFIIRGDYRYSWPHDVIVSDRYVYYTDHFSFHMGRLDKVTGEVKEFPYVGREGEPVMEADPSGRVRERQGAHDIGLDSQGRVIMGMRNHLVRFDPNTEEFTLMTPGNSRVETFALDPNDNVLAFERDGWLNRFDTRTGLATEYRGLPTPCRVYDQEADSQGRVFINCWGEGVIRVFDYGNEQTLTDYPTPTPASGPRRGKVDAQDRYWVALYWAGMLAMLDPDTGVINEYPVIPGTEPFGPPFVSPYSLTVDDRNQIVWTNDFNSDRIYKFDMGTEEMTEYMMPERYEIRDLEADKYSDRPTIWIPDYRPTNKSQIVKVQIR